MGIDSIGWRFTQNPIALIRRYKTITGNTCVNSIRCTLYDYRRDSLPVWKLNIRPASILCRQKKERRRRRLVLRRINILRKKMIFIIIVQVRDKCTLFIRDCPFIISIQIIYLDFTWRTVIHKHLILFFIQMNIKRQYILFRTLTSTINLLQSFASRPVKYQNFSLTNIRQYQDIFTDIRNLAFDNKFIRRLQRNIFHIHKILQNQFFLWIIYRNIYCDKTVWFINSASH